MEKDSSWLRLDQNLHRGQRLETLHIFPQSAIYLLSAHKTWLFLVRSFLNHCFSNFYADSLAPIFTSWFLYGLSTLFHFQDHEQLCYFLTSHSLFCCGSLRICSWLEHISVIHILTTQILHRFVHTAHLVSTHLVETRWVILEIKYCWRHTPASLPCCSVCSQHSGLVLLVWDISWKEIAEDIQIGVREWAQSVDNCLGDSVLELSLWVFSTQ